MKRDESEAVEGEVKSEEREVVDGARVVGAEAVGEVDEDGGVGKERGGVMRGCGAGTAWCRRRVSWRMALRRGRASRARGEGRVVLLLLKVGLVGELLVVLGEDGVDEVGEEEAEWPVRLVTELVVDGEQLRGGSSVTSSALNFACSSGRSESSYIAYTSVMPVDSWPAIK